MPLSSPALTHFLTVYKLRSLGKASRHLGLSQPALSRTIRRLEDELDVVLFERRSTGMDPTMYADALALRAMAVMSEARKASDEILHLKLNLIGEARIGIGPGLASSPLPRVIAQLRQAHPGLTVLVFEGLFNALVDKVLTGEIDVAITTTPFLGVRGELDYDVLYRDEFVVAAGASHPLTLRDAPVDAEELLSANWVLPPRDGDLWQRVTELFRRHEMYPPEPVVETNSGVCIKGLLQTGEFVSFVPKELIGHEVELGELASLPVTDFGIERELIALRRRNAVIPPASDVLISHFKNAVVRTPDASGQSRPIRGSSTTAPGSP